MTKIAVVGYGKMGQVIGRIAKERGHQIVVIDPHHPEADFADVTAESLTNVQVGIEFTNPEVVITNINKFNALRVPLVVGTTGWYQEISEVKAHVADAKNALIYASNFSVGVNVFFKVVEAAAKIINKFPEFDISGLDIHHNKKVDSPSGTAMTAAQILIENIGRKSTAVYDKLDRAPESHEIHFASLRSGNVPGTHQIFLDSPAESVNIEVVARNREGYALGSVIAAEWLYDKQGFFKFEDLIDQIIDNEN